MLLEVGVTDRATMGLMGWSSASMAGRYQHLTDPIRKAVTDQIGGHLWTGEEAADDPPNGA